MAILQQCPRCKAKLKVATKACKCGVKLDAAKRSGRVKFFNDFYLPGGRRRREFVGMSIDEARAAEGKRRGQKKEGRIFDMLPDSKKTFAELAEWFQGQDKTKTLSYFVAIQAHLKLFKAALGDRLANSIMPSDIENLQVRLKDDGYSASYIDQVVDTARYMATKALDNDLIGGDCLKPFRKIKAVLKRGANARQRVLTFAEYQALVDASPVHLKPVIALGFLTGMRLGEILPLQWSQIDLAGRMIKLTAADTKEGMPKRVPLPKALRDMLLALPGRGQSGPVFTYKGKVRGDIRDGLKRGCKAAKIAYGQKVDGGFVFHDLRHCFSTYARRSGVPRNVIMTIMGHSKGGDMNARYDLVEDSDLLAAVDLMADVFSATDDQTSDQGAKPNR